MSSLKTRSLPRSPLSNLYSMLARRGKHTLIYGVCRSGKSYLCHAFLLALLNHSENTVDWIDSRRSFSPELMIKLGATPRSLSRVQYARVGSIARLQKRSDCAIFDCINLRAEDLGPLETFRQQYDFSTCTVCSRDANSSFKLFFDDVIELKHRTISALFGKIILFA